MKNYIKTILTIALVGSAFSATEVDDDVYFKAKHEQEHRLLFQGYEQFYKENGTPLMKRYNPENLKQTEMFKRVFEEGFSKDLTEEQKAEFESFKQMLKTSAGKTVGYYNYVYLEALYLLKAAGKLEHNQAEKDFLIGISQSLISGNFYEFFLNPENWDSLLNFSTEQFNFDKSYEKYPRFENTKYKVMNTIQGAIRELIPYNSYVLYGQDKVGIDLLLQGIFHNLNFISVPQSTNEHVDGHGTSLTPLGFGIHDLLHKLVNTMPKALEYWILKSYDQLDESAKKNFKLAPYFARFKDVMENFSKISNYYIKKGDFVSAKNLQLGLFLALHEFPGSTSDFLNEPTLEKMFGKIFENSKRALEHDFGFRKDISVKYDLLKNNPEAIEELRKNILEQLSNTEDTFEKPVSKLEISFKELNRDFQIAEIKLSNLDQKPKIASYPTLDFQLKNSEDYSRLLELKDLPKLNDEKFGILGQRTKDNYDAISNHIKTVKEYILNQLDESHEMIRALLLKEKHFNIEYENVDFALEPLI